MIFDEAFDRVLGHEGGYVHDPNDPGGETKWGISKRSYPHVIIADLTRDDAKRIYFKDFWKPLRADRLPDGVAFQVFDFAVNSGIGTAIRYLQRAVGVADDGWWGPVSQAATDAMTESDIILRLNGERLDYLTRLSTWSHFGRGWARRIANNLRYGALDA
jgi:lysozyme family protein